MRACVLPLIIAHPFGATQEVWWFEANEQPPMRLEKKMKTNNAPRSLELFFLFVRVPLVLLVMIVGAQAQSMVDDPPATDSARAAITTPATTTTPVTPTTPMAPTTPIATTTLATTITPVTKAAPVMMTPVVPVPVATPVPVCERTVKADVVALDQVIMYNRLGAVNPNGMIYALKQDIVAINASQGLVAGNVRLRSDKRPRPIVLRMNIGDCLKVSFTNLLSPSPPATSPQLAVPVYMRWAWNWSAAFPRTDQTSARIHLV